MPESAGISDGVAGNSDGSGASRTANLRVRAGEILIEMLKSSQPATQSSVKQAIALSLGQLGDMQAIDPLIQLLADADAGVKLHVITRSNNWLRKPLIRNCSS